MSVTFQDGVTPLNAANLNTLESKVSKGVANGYAALDATGVVPAAQLPPASAPVSIPTGALTMFVGAAAPAGWLLCDGSAVSRSTYAALFAIIGSLYGGGDGSTTFNLPDFRGRVPVGLGTHADVATLGGNDGVALANRRPKHAHSNALTLPNHVHNGTTNPTDFANPNPGDTGATGGHITAAGDIATNGTRVGSHTHGFATGNPTTTPAIAGSIGAAGGAIDSEPYLVVNYILKT